MYSTPPILYGIPRTTLKHGPNRRHLGKPIPEPVTAVTCTSAIPNLKASEWWTGQPLASSKRGCVPAYLAKEYSDGAVRLLVHSESQRAFCPRDDKMGKEMVASTMLSLRGGSGSGRRGNPSGLGGCGRVYLFACWYTVDRHGLTPSR